MAAIEVPDELIFKALVHEIWETGPNVETRVILNSLLDGSLAGECHDYFFPG